MALALMFPFFAAALVALVWVAARYGRPVESRDDDAGPFAF